MRYSNCNIGGGVVKQDDRYVVSDNVLLNHMVVSTTLLPDGFGMSLGMPSLTSP